MKIKITLRTIIDAGIILVLGITAAVSFSNGETIQGILCLTWVFVAFQAIDIRKLRDKDNRIIHAMNQLSIVTEITMGNIGIIVEKAQELGWDLPVKEIKEDDIS